MAAKMLIQVHTVNNVARDNLSFIYRSKIKLRSPQGSKIRSAQLNALTPKICPELPRPPGRFFLLVPAIFARTQGSCPDFLRNSCIPAWEVSGYCSFVSISMPLCDCRYTWLKAKLEISHTMTIKTTRFVSLNSTESKPIFWLLRWKDDVMIYALPEILRHFQTIWLWLNVDRLIVNTQHTLNEYVDDLVIRQVVKCLLREMQENQYRQSYSMVSKTGVCTCIH